MEQTISLPIDLDYPWWVAAIYFLLAIASLVILPWDRMQTFYLVAASLFIGCLSLFGLHFATWTMRIENRGIAVTAPFDLFQSSGSMAFVDVIAISLPFRQFGGWSYPLHLESRSGFQVEIPIADLYGGEALRLAYTIIEHAPQAMLLPNRDSFVNLLGRVSRINRFVAYLRVRPTEQNRRVPDAVRQ